MSSVARVVAVLCSLFNVSCILSPWRVNVTARSPYSDVAVTVWEWPLGPDSGLRITLHEGGSEIKRLQPAGDRWRRLTEVAWDRDGTVAVLVCDGITDGVVFTYDLNRRREADAGRGQAMLRSTLTARYGLTGPRLREFGGDALEWACESEEAYRMFKEVLKDGPALEAVVVK